MRVLAIDTALAATSVGVLDAERGVMLAAESIAMERGHAEALMPLVQRVMQLARLEFAAIDRIAVTVGPGSFTGLRVGVSAARGLALAAAKPVVGITTLAAFAAPCAGAGDAPLLAAIDARHDHVYMQMFDAEARPLDPPRIAEAVEAAQLAAARSARVVGNAARMIERAWPAEAAAAPRFDVKAAPNIDEVARLGAAAQVGEALPAPLYLRAPDAKPQDAARIARQ